MLFNICYTELQGSEFWAEKKNVPKQNNVVNLFSSLFHFYQQIKT